MGLCLPSLHGRHQVVWVSSLEDGGDGAGVEDEEDSSGHEPVELPEETEVVQTVPHDAGREQDEEGPPLDAVVHGDNEDVGHEEVGLDVEEAEGPPEVPGLGVLQQGQQAQGDWDGHTAH